MGSALSCVARALGEGLRISPSLHVVDISEVQQGRSPEDLRMSIAHPS